jgi:hypothetical protein
VSGTGPVVLKKEVTLMLAPSVISSAVSNSPALFAKLLALLQFLMRFGYTASLT